jgi:stage II sporulation protein AA (anti-sigma F factor antagonist)
MEALHSRIGSIDLIQLRGRLDASCIDRVSAQLMPLAETLGHRIVLSMSELQSITSVGLRLMLLLAEKSRQQGGALALCELQGFVLEVFETSGFLDILPIEPSRKQAIARVSASDPRT